MKKIYCDYAATTPVDSRVWREMQPYFTQKFGNPGSLHSFGQQAVAAIDKAREIIARSLGVDFREIIFTSGATEANNLALRGAVREWQIQNPGRMPEIIISPIEHESVAQTAQELAASGAAKAKSLPVGRIGFVDVARLKDLISEDTAIISIISASNEIGTVQDIKKAGEIVREWRQSRKTKWPLLHTDAAQALQYLNCRKEEAGYDLATFSGHKIYGPKGVGVLVAPPHSIRAISTGGGQEFGLRSGTENVPLIVGLSRAWQIADEMRRKEALRIGRITNEFARRLISNAGGIEMNSVVAAEAKGAQSVLPNMVNVHVKNMPADKSLTILDLKGIAASTGSACAARSPEPSRILLALGFSRERASNSLRFSFGRDTKKEAVVYCAKILKELAARK